VLKTFIEKQAHFTGFQPGVLAHSIRSLPTFLRNLKTYSNSNRTPSLRPHWSNMFPILTDMNAPAGTIGGHYFHQDLWAARKIFHVLPARHIDIGSRTDGFIAHLLTFMPVTVVDIRPMHSSLEGLTFFQDDATNLRNLATDSVPSLSSLHAAEHFGLGRYGDPVDPQACFLFMAALERVLAPGGRLYFSVPIGQERVEFNAHRVFAPETILRSFSRLKLVSFAFVADDGNLHTDASPHTIPPSQLACGLFEFTKEQTN
jgi:hypothetical protein